MTGKRGHKKKGNAKCKMPVKKSRKEMRKEQRLEKKARRLNWHQRNQQKPMVKEAEVSKLQDNKKKTGNAADKYPILQQQQMEDQHKKERSKENKLKGEMLKSRKKQLLAANEEEDRNIKHLEKLLKLNRHKRKSLPKSFAEDGLGYLLEVCDSSNLNDAVKAEQALQESGSEFEEDFAIVTGKKTSEDKAHKSEGKSTAKVSKKKISPRDSQSDSDESGNESECDDNEGGGSDSEFDGSDFGLGADDGSGTDQDPMEESDDEEDEVDDGDDEGDVDDEDEDVSDDDDEEEADKYSGKKELPTVTKVSLKKKQVSFQVDSPLKRKAGSEESSLKNTKRAKTEDEGDVSRRVKQPKNKIKEKMKSRGTDNSSGDDDFSDFDDGNEDSLDDDDDDENSVGESEEDSEKRVKRNDDGTWEDIYGRARDDAGNIIEVKQTKKEKYIPPALRAKAAQEGDAKRQEQLLRLRRQMKGLINRLAENNMASISAQIDEMYMSNSRHDMNDTLTKLIMEALVSQVLTPERLVMENMLLLTVLHANVGTEVGAHFLQETMKKFDEMLRSDPPTEQKELDNIVLILSHMYNFKIFSASLMYEVLDKIAERFTEKRVELLLLILRSVGFSLRKDDPLALKSLILQLQSKAAAASDMCDSSRVKFMLDILLAIKNNNMSKIPSYDPEHIEHLKKLLRSLLRRGNYVTELKISIEDLLKAEERGRWWIVGSAWTGHLPGENPNSGPAEDIRNASQKVPGTESVYSAQLLELARKQRMNTGVRKDIFCILMTAEDYMDAFEKLLHLNLKNQQRQEIVHVLFDCCLQEKTFNPYYAHLAQKFCDFDRQYQMKFQYRLWDKLKEVDELSASQLSNLARLLAHLCLERGLPISALKVMSFADMDKACVRLVRQILLSVLLAQDEDACQAVFLRVAPSPQLHLFREGLRLFISHFVLRNIKSLPHEEQKLLQERAKKADVILTAAESKIQF